MSKRRTPPLFEVLSGPDNRSVPSGPASVLGGRGPVRVRMPETQVGGEASAEGQGGAPAKAVRIPLAAVFIGVGLLLALFFGGWAVVYQLGAKHKESDLARYLEAKEPVGSPTAPAAMPAPTIYQGDPASPAAAGLPSAAPAQPVADPPLADPRKAGNNYLHVATMSWKDAEKAVAYLNKNGVAAAAVPSKPVDPSEARAKNLPHLVFAIDGVPSDQFRASEAKRQALEERVRRIGKKWQREEHGPSDFGQPGWSKYK